MTVSSLHPPPPWRLAGTSVQVLQTLPIDIARSAVPSALRIVPVAPGKTLSVLFCARYEAGSTLAYHELAIAPALTRAGFRAGLWISHIYVDSLISMIGGQSIWGLPKRLARFQWDDGLVEVFDGPTQLCGVRWLPARYSIPAALVVPVFSRRDSRLLRFSVAGSALVGPCRGSVAVGPRAPFASFGFEAARAIVQTRLRARIGAPR